MHKYVFFFKNTAPKKNSQYLKTINFDINFTKFIAFIIFRFQAYISTVIFNKFFKIMYKNLILKIFIC